MSSIDFYFDPISPYVYLAWTQLPKFIAQTQAQVRFKPILFFGLLQAHNQKGPAEVAAKRTYIFTDVMRWAKLYNVPFEGPPSHPFRPLLPLRMMLAVTEEKDRQRLAGKILDACWGKGQDVTKPEVLLQLATEIGLDGAALLEKSNDPAVKDQLRQNTEEAIAKGIFGVPSFVANGEIFWGCDRMDLLREHLKNPFAVDKSKLDKMTRQDVLEFRKN